MFTGQLQRGVRGCQPCQRGVCTTQDRDEALQPLSRAGGCDVTSLLTGMEPLGAWSVREM